MEVVSRSRLNQNLYLNFAISGFCPDFSQNHFSESSRQMQQKPHVTAI